MTTGNKPVFGYGGFEAVKSRSFIMKKSNVTDRFVHRVQNADIHSEQSNQVFGQVVRRKSTRQGQRQQVEKQVNDDLKKIDNSYLPGTFKTWLYQHALLPSLVWPLMLYDVPSSTVEALERITSRHLRKWLRIPPNFSSVGLYGKSNRLQLPLSSLVEFKTSKTRLVLILRNSPDEQIRGAGIVTRTGR